MAQDYHIYVHFKGGSGTNETTSNTKPKSPTNQSEGFVAPTALLSKTKSTFISEATSMSGLNVAGIIAIGVMAVNLIDKGVQVVQKYQSKYGDYSGVVARDNFWKNIKNGFNPLGMMIGGFLQQIDIDIENERKMEARKLTGDVLVFGASKRGY